MPSYLFEVAEYPDVPRQDQARNDDFLFNQGRAGGLGQTRFHDYRRVFETSNVPNVQRFFEQTETFRELLTRHPPTPDQMQDVDFLLAVGNIFALVVYAQLILENSRIYEIDDDLVDQIFDFMVRDMSRHALTLSLQSCSTEAQVQGCRNMLRKAIDDPKRYDRVWQSQVLPLDGVYEMNA